MIKKIAVIAILCIMIFVSFVPPESASAYLWSPTYNVSISLSFKPKTGAQAINAVDCTSAKLYVGGITYTATVSNPWLSNSCKLTFNKVKVNTNGNYTLQVSYKAYFLSSTKSLSVYLSRPIGATLSKSYTVYY